MSADQAVTQIPQPPEASDVAMTGDPSGLAATSDGMSSALRSAGARGAARSVVRWVVVAIVGVVVVLYALSPVFEQRDQHRSLTREREAIRQSSLESSGFLGYSLPTEAPAIGSTVGILEIGRLKLQAAVTEGVGPAQTEAGPGHVPGTAGLGQPGNAVVVGRRAAFGSPFSNISSLHRGDSMVVTTAEGQSLYLVTQTRAVTLTGGGASGASAALGSQAAATPEAPSTLGTSIDIENLYGPSADNRLTLVTSGSVLPWNTSKAMVVIAVMKTEPFSPSPQQAQSSTENGRSAAPGVLALLVVAVLAFGGAAIGASLLYRRCPPRTAYLLSTAPVIVATVLLALAVTRALPAWA